MATFTASDGIEIAFYEYGERAADDVPVVLQHGFAASSQTNWVQPGVVTALQAAGRSVIAVDARGHGQSGKPHDPAFYGEPRMAADLSELFDHLGITQLDLVGYSMGAIISLLTAANETRIRRLVVGGIGGGVVEMGGVDRRHLDTTALADALRADDPTTVTNPVARGFRLFADSQGSDRFALAAQAESVHRSAIALDQISAVESLVLVGRDDPLAVRPEVLSGAIPRASLAVVDGDHLSALRSAEFAPAVVEFVGR